MVVNGVACVTNCIFYFNAFLSFFFFLLICHASNPLNNRLTVDPRLEFLPR